MTYSTTSSAEFSKTFWSSNFHTFHKVEFEHFISCKCANGLFTTIKNA